MNLCDVCTLHQVSEVTDDLLAQRLDFFIKYFDDQPVQAVLAILFLHQMP